MADDSPIDSFLVGIGFAKPDVAGARAQEDLVQRTKARITDIQGREGAKRADADGRAQSDGLRRFREAIAKRTEAEQQSRERRASAAAQAFGEAIGLDKEQSAQLLKHLREGASKSVEVEKDRAKKINVIHGEQLKTVEANALRFVSVFTGIGTGLGAALSAVPFGGFLAGLERSAAGLSRLDVQARRTGSSAAGIQRFLFSMKQQGVDEGEAASALEGFASTMKNNPEGYRQALDRLRVKTTGPDGKPLDNDALLENFGGYLATQPFNIARIQAGQFGILGDNVIAALQDPAGTRRGLKAYDDKLAGFGLDPNKVAEDARKVQQSWDNLEADFKVIKQKLDSEFFLPFMGALDGLAKKLEENPQAVENFGRGMEVMAIGLTARVLPVLANLSVRLAGLSPVLGGAMGAALGIAVNPVVALGASAESTPGAGVPADAAERAKVEAENKRLTDEANKRQGSTGSFWQDSWNYIKGKIGLGDDTKVKADIATTAEATKKLADRADAQPPGGGLDGVTASSGGLGGSGQHSSGGSGRVGGGVTSPGASLGDRGHGGHGFGHGAGPIDGNLPTGNVPGASGFGLINAYWRGPLNGKGEGGYTGPKEMFDYLKSQGASDNEALLLTGAASSESSFNPTAVHDIHSPNGPGYGLFGHNIAHRLDLRGKNWQQQSVAALGEMRRMLGGRVNAARTPEELTDLEMHYEGPRGYHRNTPRSGDNYMGRLNSIRRFSALTGRPTAQAPVPAGTSEAAIGDAAAFAAEQRLKAGGSDPRDRALLDRYRAQQNAPKAAGDLSHVRPGHPDDDRASRSRAGDVPSTYGWHLSPVQYTHGGGRNPLSDLHRGGWLGKPLPVEVTKPLPGLSSLQHAHKVIADAIASGRHLMPHSVPPLGVSTAMLNSISNRHHYERHGDTFHVHGGDVKTALNEAAKVSARREGQDRVRYGQG